MNNKATGSTMNKACQLCKTVHDDAEFTIIYDTIYACKACVAAPDLAKVAKIILSTSYRDERTAVVVGFLESQAKEVAQLKLMVEKGNFIAERYIALKTQDINNRLHIEELTQKIEELKAAKRPPIVGKL